MSIRPGPARCELLEPRRLFVTITWDGGGDGVQWSDPLNWSSDIVPAPIDQVIIEGAATPLLADDQTLASLSLASTAKLTVASGSPKILRVGELSIATTARLDLGNNDLIVDSTAPRAFFRMQHYVTGSSTIAPRIISSTSNGSQTLALFDNALMGASTWRGQTLSSVSVVGHYTYYGDVNLDDQVTVEDYFTVDANLNTFPPGGAAWLRGDANRDGRVTGDDYTVIDANLGRGVQPSALRVNSGGPALRDSLARNFDGDSGFTGGTIVSATGDVLETNDDELFNTWRTGANFTFTGNVASGAYTLVLQFAEREFTGPGQRTFDVFAEGAPILDNFDVFAAAGNAAHTAIARSFNVRISDNQLDLAFVGETGDATVAAFVLIPNDVPPAAQVYGGQYQHDSVKLVRAQSYLRQIGQAVLLYSNENRGRFPPDLATLIRTQDISHETFAGPRTGTITPRGLLSPLERAAYVASLNDFIYRGAGMNSSAPEDAIVAYENPHRVAGDLNALMGNGSVRSFTRQELAAQLATTFPAEPTDPPAPLPPPALPLDARIVQSQANLRHLGGLLWTHSANFKGRFPMTWGEMAYNSSLNLNAFINPRSDSFPPPPNMTLEEKAAWMDGSTDYLYLGAGQRNSAHPDLVLAYENPYHFTDGINILFNDGRVVFLELPWAREILAQSGVSI